MLKTVAAAVFCYVLTACTGDALFHITGHVGAGVDYVVATSPSHGVTKYVAAVSGGDFDLAVAPGYAWVVTFADSHQVGAAMVVGTLQAGTLDAFAPRDAGSLDLGTVTFTAGRAHAETAATDITAALGISDALAAQLGAADDLATRYANPDIDNDGVLDALQTDHDFHLDVTAKLDLQVAGAPATLDSLVRGDMFTAADAGAAYRETGIVVGLPAAYAGEMANVAMTFDNDFYGSSLGAATPMIAAGTPVAQPELKLGSIGGQPSLGAFARPGHDVPTGDYRIAVGGHVLAFSDVRVARDADLAAATGLLVPFVQLVPVEADCVTDCRIQSIKTAWKRHTAQGWVDAELVQGAHVEIVRSHGGAMQTLGMNMPATPSSVLAWSALALAKGMTADELAGITTAELCYVAVSYDDGVGMKVTSQVTNPACGY